jgi:protein-disulfide isomerase
VILLNHFIDGFRSQQRRVGHEILIAAMAILFAVSNPIAFAQTPPQTSQSPPASPATPVPTAIQKKVEDYLRHIYAWEPSFKVSIGTPEATPIPGLYKLAVTVGQGDQSDTATFYVSKDGRYLMSGGLDDLNGDPLADIRKQISLDDAPSKGPVDAKVVMVEYGDFECPTCKAFDTTMRTLLPKYPQVRFVFKDFPLVEIHPWAMTAAIAGRCAYQQSHDGFWKFHDLVFDNQELISAENAWDKLQDLASQSGMDPAALRGCMADPKTREAVDRSREEGLRLNIANTPTIFINGRRQIGGTPAVLEQYLHYELITSNKP